MKNIDWWRSVSQHMWRTYFALRQNGCEPEKLQGAKRRIYDACHPLYTTKFEPDEQEILRMYFTSQWGRDLHAVENYSRTRKIPSSSVWSVIRQANRAVMVEIGLLERKETANGQTHP